MDTSLYIHIPFCKSKCDYCDFYSLDSRNLDKDGFGSIGKKVVDALGSQITDIADTFSVNSWKTVYIGGGTPSLLSPTEIISLGEILRKTISVKPFTTDEWTIEANPEDLTSEWLNTCTEAGITRLSLGIQSMDTGILKSVGRRGTRESNLKALELVAAAWKGDVSLDLIAGLPGQTPDGLRRDLDELFVYNPDHFSLYSLTIEDGTPMASKNKRGLIHNLPDDDESASIWIQGRDALEKKGYHQYEVSNFSKPMKESIHNTAYWEMDGWLAAGPSSSATIIRADATAQRYTVERNLQKWLKSPCSLGEIELINRKDLFIEHMLMGFRQVRGLSRTKTFERFGLDPVISLKETIASWTDRHLLQPIGDRIALTGEGLLFLNSFLADCIDEVSREKAV